MATEERRKEEWSVTGKHYFWSPVWTTLKSICSLTWADLFLQLFQRSYRFKAVSDQVFGSVMPFHFYNITFTQLHTALLGTTNNYYSWFWQVEEQLFKRFKSFVGELPIFLASIATNMFSIQNIQKSRMFDDIKFIFMTAHFGGGRGTDSCECGEFAFFFVVSLERWDFHIITWFGDLEFQKVLKLCTGCFV